MLYHFSYQFFMQIHNLERKMQICQVLNKHISDIRAEIVKNRPKWAKMNVKKNKTFFEGPLSDSTEKFLRRIQKNDSILL